MTTTADKAPVYLQVWTEHRDGYFHIYATPCRRGMPGESDTRDRPCGLGDVSDNPLSGLHVTSQGNDRDRDNPDHATANRLYGWDVVYRGLYSVDLRDAERMVKALRLVARALSRAYETDGNAESFATYLSRKGLTTVRTPVRMSSMWERIYAVAVDGTRITFECQHGHRWAEDLGSKRIPVPKRLSAQGAAMMASWWSKEKGGCTGDCPKCKRGKA